MTALDARTEACLEAAGWHRDRSWEDLPAALSKVAALGYAIVPAGSAFLTEFGGLSIRHPSLGGPDTESKLDPIAAASDLHHEWLGEYERRAGVTLMPVGEAYDGHMTVFIGDDGRAFLAYDHEFQCIGDDAIDALNWLCVGPAYHAARARRHLDGTA